MKINNLKNDARQDDDWEYDDDCPICQAMKEGKADTLEGLYLATKEAQRQGKGLVWVNKKFEKEMKKRLKDSNLSVP